MSNATSDVAPTIGGLLDNYPDVDRHSCQLLGPTALVVQALMGVMVILSLVYKRHREAVKRPWRIWLFDVSKQIVGQMFVHGVNVFVSDIVSHHTSSNACVFYFLNILIDTTFGVGIIYVNLYLLTYLFSEKLNYKGFESGVYGTPPSINFWMRQAALYVLSLTSMKMLVVALLVLFPGIFKIGEWLLSWTQVAHGDAVQVIFVMGLFPIIMNVLQFWLIDSIVKASDASSVALDSNTPDAFDADREPLFAAPPDDDDDDHHHGHADLENQRNTQLDSVPITTHDKLYAHSNTTLDEEYKSHAGTSEHNSDAHSYPPSLSSSLSSNSTSFDSKVPKEAKNLLKKANRRAPPAPLNIHPMTQPAVNSPQLSAAPVTVPRTPMATIRKPSVVAAVIQDDWAETWDDHDDDWAHKIGEEDWTQQKREDIRSTPEISWDESRVLSRSS